MPRRGKGQKRETANITQPKRMDLRTETNLDRAVAGARHSIEKFAAAIDDTFKPRKRKKNPNNRSILKAPSVRELRLGTLVVSNADGTVRPARQGETPIGKVISRSHRIRNKKATFYASVAQSVERPVEAREAGVQSLSGAPTFQASVDWGSLEHGGGSRAREGHRQTAEEASGPGSEHAGIHRRPAEWQREGSRPSWYAAVGAEGGREGREES